MSDLPVHLLHLCVAEYTELHTEMPRGEPIGLPKEYWEELGIGGTGSRVEDRRDTRDDRNPRLTLVT